VTAMVVKALIALVGFPVLAHAMYVLMTMLLNVVLPPVLAMAGDWSTVLSKTAVVMSLLIALRFSFGVCRRMWPMPAVK
jgi:hypothetical protein